jgi:membrane protein required for colicin V production
VLLDLLVLAVLAVASLHGAMGGALRQLVQLGAAVLGWLAARHLGPHVAEGFARSVHPLLARAGASALLFLGTFALVSLVGGAILRSTGLAAVVKGPTDRGAGALLGGAKGALVAWVLLSALALTGGRGPAARGIDARASDFAGLARRHNLLVRLDPEKARLLERALRAAREAERAGAREGQAAESRALLADPRLRALAEGGGEIDPAEVERLLEDPEVRSLVERLHRDRVEAEGGAD